MIFHSDFETGLILSIQELIGKWPFLKGLFQFFTIFGEPVFAVALIGFVYWGYRKDQGRYLILCVMTTQIFNNMLKNIFLRPRPYMANDQIQCLKAPESEHDLYNPIVQGYSFPSGHSSCVSSFAMSLNMRKNDRKLRIASFLLVALVGISRFALGVHYPSDVLCGILLGIVSVLVIDRLIIRMKIEDLYLLIASIGLAGVFFCRSEDYFSVFGIALGFMAGERFEARYIGFENTKDYKKMILRTIIGGILFLAVSFSMEVIYSYLPIDRELVILLLRSLRYGLSSFVVMGLYPYLFSYSFLK